MSYETEMVPYSLEQTRKIHALLAQFKAEQYSQDYHTTRDKKIKLNLTSELVAGLLDVECYRNANVNTKKVVVNEYYGSAQEIGDHGTVCCVIRIKQGVLAEWWLPQSPMLNVIPESSRQDDGSIKPIPYFKLQVTEEPGHSLTYRFEPFTDTDENLEKLFFKDNPFEDLGDSIDWLSGPEPTEPEPWLRHILAIYAANPIVGRKEYYMTQLGGMNDLERMEHLKRTRDRLLLMSQLGMEETGTASFGVPGLMSGLYIEKVWNLSAEEWEGYIGWVKNLIREHNKV